MPAIHATSPVLPRQGPNTVRCPYCKTDDDRVVDSRASADGGAIRRRRLCRECGRRYTTYERVEGAGLRVVKKSGERVDFERSKIMAGLLRACEKRSISTEQLERLVDSVERQCMEAFDKEVPSKVIGELIMEQLRGIDQVAYVRFASVYRDFKDAGQFLDELQHMVVSGQLDSAQAEAVGRGVDAARRGAASSPPAAGDDDPDGEVAATGLDCLKVDRGLKVNRRGLDEDARQLPDRQT